MTGSTLEEAAIYRMDVFSMQMKGFLLKWGQMLPLDTGLLSMAVRSENGTLVGMGAIILNGAKIGRNCVIGAGTLVTQGTVVPDNMLVIGSPGKVKREVTETEIRENLKNTNGYVKLGREYREKEKR